MNSYLHDFVEEYLESCGQPQDALALHEEINDISKRSWNFDCLKEYADEMMQGEEYAKEDWICEDHYLQSCGLL